MLTVKTSAQMLETAKSGWGEKGRTRTQPLASEEGVLFGVSDPDLLIDFAFRGLRSGERTPLEHRIAGSDSGLGCFHSHLLHRL